MSFPFPPLKLPNKENEEYSKMIFFILFHFIPFPPPKQSLSNVEQLPIIFLEKQTQTYKEDGKRF